MKIYLIWLILTTLIAIAIAQQSQPLPNSQNKEENETLYDALGIGDDANSDQIKKAFRKLSIQYHPDRNHGKPEIEKKYLQIKRAYEILIDVSKRNTYDLFGEKGLEQIQKRPKPKGGDFRTEMSLPLSMFYKGGQTMYSFRRGMICKACKGTGDSSGSLQTCESCNGTGKMFRQVKVKDQVKKIEMKCKDCKGSGHAGKTKCPVCGGQKIVLQPRDLKYQVQKGMREGDKILFKGQSEQGFQFYPGDVYLSLRQHPHSHFKRIKNDLEVKQDITLKQAILGFQKTIKHLDDHTVDIVGDYNVQDGQRIVIKGEGMPIRGQFDSFGDMLAKVNIKFPKKYTPEQLDEMKAIFLAGGQERQGKTDKLQAGGNFEL